ncbi:MAG: LacI family DNA-binding transcriptional regulator [Propionivibrio sp.]
MCEAPEIAVTIKDVARQTGLSIATISKYLNGGNVLERNRQAIAVSIGELGFRVNEIARGLKTSRTMTVGVLIPDLENVFCTSIVAHIENVLQQSGYGTIVCDYREDPDLERAKLEFLANKLVDGFIYMPLGKQDGDVDRYVAQLIANDLPVILIDRPLAGTGCDTVLVDNLNASYNAVEHLIVRGHRRIGIIAGPTGIYTAQERLKGYRRVHEDFALAIEADLILEGDYSIESGYRLMTDFLDRPARPTAVYITNYEMTLGAMMALNEGRVVVPDDISIIGFDNLQLARIIKPALAIVVQPIQAIGETAAGLLLKRMKNDRSGFPAIHRLKTEFVVGASVRNLVSGTMANDAHPRR